MSATGARRRRPLLSAIGSSLDGWVGSWPSDRSDRCRLSSRITLSSLLQAVAVLLRRACVRALFVKGGGVTQTYSILTPNARQPTASTAPGEQADRIAGQWQRRAGQSFQRDMSRRCCRRCPLLSSSEPRLELLKTGREKRNSGPQKYKAETERARVSIALWEGVTTYSLSHREPVVGSL